MVQKKLPLINSAHGSDTRNIINELIKLFNGMGYTYNESLQKAQDVLNEAKQTNDMNADVQQQIDNVVAGVADADSEVAQARGSHNVLNGRLQEFDTSIYNDGTNASIFGAMGDGVTDDTLALQSAINESRGNALHLKAKADYIISDTLVLHEDNKIIGNDSRLILNANVDGVMIPKNAIVEGLNFRSGITGHDKFFIRLDDQSGFNVATTGYIKDIKFRGDDERLSKGIGAYDEGEHGVVTYFNASNLTFNRMGDGVYFKNTHTSSWYNGNIFDGVRMYDCVYFITLDGTCDGNDFKRVQIQPSNRTITGIKCNGDNNKFDVTSWDYNHYPDADPYDFTDGSTNELNTNLRHINHNLYKGMNTTNKLNSSNINSLVVPKVTTDGTNITNKSGSSVPVHENFNGNQDDVFTFADKLYTITTTGPDINNGIGIHHVFRNNRYAPRWSLNPNEEVKINIVGTYNFLDVFGLLFTRDFPDYLTIKHTTNTGTVREIKFDYISNPAVYTNEITGSTTTEIEITFGVRESKNVRLSRIFGSSRYMSQTTFVETGGGNMYGDLTLHEGTLRLNSPDGSLFRLNVANDGTLSTTKI